jgi:signal transduction histidine kinase
MPSSVTTGYPSGEQRDGVLTPGSAIAELTGELLETERVRSERLLNGVRAIVLVLLSGGALLYSNWLTPELNTVNVSVLLPMLVWTLGQQVAFHRGRHAPRWLSTVNGLVDTTALSLLLAGYGVFGLAELSVKSPMILGYVVIIAAQPLTSSARRAAGVAALVVFEYAALVLFLILSGELALIDSPLATPTTAGTSLLDEGARLLLLAATGGAATYATARHEATLRRALAAQVQRDAERRDLIGRLQEADKLAAVGTLAATIAHEVSNPLATISLAAEMLEHTSPLTDEQRADLRSIGTEARRTAEVVKDFLRVARGRESAEEAVSLSLLARSAVSVLRPLLRDQRIRVELALADDAPSFTGSGSRLEQVVLNLVINAAHAMEGRNAAKVVRVSTGRDGSHAWLSVEDTGPGFAPGVIDRIFDRFFTTKPIGKGTGLGLWIAREIVGEHGGTIEAGNRPDGGARFLLRFPIDWDVETRQSA